MRTTALVPPRFRSHAVAFVVLCAVAAVAAGCTLLGAGSRDSAAPSLAPGEVAWTFAAASDEAREIPGVDDIFMSVGPIGLPNTREMAVRADVQDGYPEELIPPLVDYLLALAWSVPDEKPDFRVSFAMLLGDSSPDLESAADALGWEFQDGSSKIEVSSSDLENRYGEWPGKRPELPAELANVVLPETGLPGGTATTEPSPTPTP